MKVPLKTLQNISQNIYILYNKGYFTQEEYLELLRPLDKEIDRVELRLFSVHPQDIFVFEKSFL